jgi:outer membrane protein
VKNASLLLNSVLLVAVGFLYYLHFTPVDANHQPASGSLGAKSALNTNNGQVVYVNTDTLLEHYEYFKVKKQELEAKGKRLETELAGRMRNLENEYTTARDKVQRGTMSNSLMQETEKDLMRKQQQLQIYKEEQAAKLMEEEKNINEQLNDNIRNFLSTFGKKNGYNFVLGMSGSGGVLFANDSLNITTSVLEGLNKEYKAVK